MSIIFQRRGDAEFDHYPTVEQIDAVVRSRFTGWIKSLCNEKGEDLTDVPDEEIERLIQTAVTNALFRLNGALAMTTCAIEQTRLKQTAHFTFDAEVFVDGLPGDSYREFELVIYKLPK